MAKIARIEILQVDLRPKVARSDAIQAFTAQETPIVRITDSEGATGWGYSYTIGTGGSSVVALLRDHLAPRLVGRESMAARASAVSGPTESAWVAMNRSRQIASTASASRPTRRGAR